MAQREKGGRVVFIGNIPYGVSEEQICEIFGRVGTVVGFRLVYDKETSRPKGFGFLEYTDTDAAASAVRNLNEHEIMGRTLRVDYSNDNGGGKKKEDEPNRAPPPAGFNAGPPQQNGGGGGGALPPLPQGADLPAGLTAPDAISKTLQTFQPPQLLDILSQFKGLSQFDPNQATALLSQAPQLGYAIFQALLQLGMVDPTILGSLITQQPAPPPQQQQAPQPPQPVMPYGMPPGYPPQQPPPVQAPPQQYSTPQQQYAGYPPQQQAPPQHYAPTPPVQQPAYQPPPPQPSYQAPPPQQQGGIPPQTQAMLQAMPPDQQAAIAQVLAMSKEQILGLPDGPKQQIIAVRQQFGMPVV